MDVTKIKEDFIEGYDCSQVVLCHFAEELGICEEEANRMAAGFGGGMLLGSVCGAYTGALMALGLKYGHSNPNDLLEQKNIMTAKNMAFHKKIMDEFGTIECKELLGYDVSTPEGLQAAVDSGRLIDYCPHLAGKVIQIVQEIFDEDK